MIAISVTEKKLTAPIDLRFGRAPYFYISDGEESRFIVNPYCKEEHNVAPRVVELLAKENVDKIITGEIGPKAHTSLQEHKIQVIMLDEEQIKLSQVIKKIEG